MQALSNIFELINHALNSKLNNQEQINQTTNILMTYKIGFANH
jgi:hypothetical protein